jgi:hypothetical protein
VAATALRPFADADPDTARLQLSPDGSGRVDGAWWPRSDDLTAEVPGLAAALQSRLGTIERVAYHPAAWAPAPRRAGTGRDGRPVRRVPDAGPRGRRRLRRDRPADPARRPRGRPGHRGGPDHGGGHPAGATGTVESLLAPYRAAASG